MLTYFIHVPNTLLLFYLGRILIFKGRKREQRMSTIKNTGSEQQNSTNYSSALKTSLLNKTKSLAEYLVAKSTFQPTPINTTHNDAASSIKDQALEEVTDKINSVINKLSNDLGDTSKENKPALSQEEKEAKIFLMSLIDSLVGIFSGLGGEKKENTEKTKVQTPLQTIKSSANSNNNNSADTNTENNTPPISLKVQLALMIDFAEMVSKALEGRSDSEFSDLIENIDQEYKQQESLDSVMQRLADHAEMRKAEQTNNKPTNTPVDTAEIPAETMTMITELIADILQMLGDLGFVKGRKVTI